MSVLVASVTVLAERVSSSTDATGWTTDTDRVVIYQGPGQAWPNRRGAERGASGGGDAGPFDPTIAESVVVLLPPDAGVEPGDILTVEGREWVAGFCYPRRGPVASLDHLRVEAVGL